MSKLGPEVGRKCGPGFGESRMVVLFLENSRSADGQGAGSYKMSFAGSSMPFGRPYFGPVHDVPEPYNFMNFQEEELIERQPFGVRIHGVPLSAVPEAPAFGLTAAPIAAATASGLGATIRSADVRHGHVPLARLRDANGRPEKDKKRDATTRSQR